MSRPALLILAAFALAALLIAGVATGGPGDTEDPVVTAPGDITTPATSPSGATVNYPNATATDNVGVTVGPDCGPPSSGSLFPIGLTTVTCSAGDAAGNTGTDTFDVTVTPYVDNVDPDVTAPGDITTPATSPSGATVNYANATATDNVGVTVGPDCGPPSSGSLFPIGLTTVTCSAGDAAGNTGTDTFDVTVTPYVDNVDPDVTAPGDITTPATSPSGATVNYPNATATDNVGVTVGPDCGPPSSGSLFPIGLTTVTCSAGDAAGNTGTDTFDVTVTPYVDNVDPDVTAPGDVTFEATSPSGATVNYPNATATDNVGVTVGPDCGPPSSGSLFPIGLTTVTCSAGDAAGNTGTDTFDVTVQDTTEPTVSVPASMTVQPTGPSGATVNYPNATATDNVGVTVGPTCTPASGSLFPLGTNLVTCTASDGAGNTGQNSFSISVQDANAPVVTAPASRTVEANAPTGSVVNFVDPAAASDIADGPLSAPCSPKSGSLFPIGQTTVTCSVKDSDGHTGSASFVINVVDTTPPVLTAPADLTLASAAAVPATDPKVAAFLSGATATDLADTKPTITTNAPATFPPGQTTVTFTAKDKAGNVTAKSAVVSVVAPGTPIPTTNPDATPPDNVRSVRAGLGNLSVLIRWSKPAAKDFAYVEITRSPGRHGEKESSLYKGQKQSFRDVGLTAGVEYRYLLVAYDKAGNRAVGVAVVIFAQANLLLTPVDGARVTGAPRLTWKKFPRATYYDVLLFRGKRKIGSFWPAGTSLQLSKSWKYGGASQQLAGCIDWWVFPGYGSKAAAKYGSVLGHNQFCVKPKSKKA